ncbi:unnamed protein product [Durusdinium trenchii]|uniref:Uncharacterized protein n=2 Tax=Durusdinium trenchii TaxID=1381693 RepID=A0ABP0JE42_9DINO
MNVAAPVWCILAVACARLGECLFLRQSDARDFYPQLAPLLAAVNETSKLESDTTASLSAPYLHSIEATLTSMAQGLSQAPGDSVSQVKADVVRMIDNLLRPRILAEHDAIQSQVAAFSSSFAKCETERAVALNQSYSKQEGLPLLIANHKACRLHESKLGYGLASCKETLQSSKEVDASTCEAAKMEGIPDVTSCASHGEDVEQYHRRVIAQFRERLDSIRHKKVLCSNTTEALKLQEAVCAGQADEIQQHRSRCNSRQEEIDSTVCDLSTSMSTTCARYKACRSQVTVSYDLVRRTVQSREETLQDEWKALGRIECILDAMSKLDAVVATQECFHASYSVSHLNVNYVTIPESAPCAALAEIPGTAEYNNTVFQGLPDNVPLAMCSAECCYRSSTPVR